MRVNVYAEEMTDRIEIISKKTPDGSFTGLRFWLALPTTATQPIKTAIEDLEGVLCDPEGEVSISGSKTDMKIIKEALATLKQQKQIQGPLMHYPGDDDSAAVTFWGKTDMRSMLRQALELLDKHYEHQDRADDMTFPE